MIQTMTQVEYRRHQDNLGASLSRAEANSGYQTNAPGFGPRGGAGGPGGPWTRNRANPRGLGDDHHPHRQVSWGTSFDRVVGSV